MTDQAPYLVCMFHDSPTAHVVLKQKGSWAVSCDVCGASGPVMPSAQGAIEAWNSVAKNMATVAAQRDSSTLTRPSRVAQQRARAVERHLEESADEFVEVLARAFDDHIDHLPRATRDEIVRQIEEQLRVLETRDGYSIGWLAKERARNITAALFGLYDILDPLEYPV